MNKMTGQRLRFPPRILAQKPGSKTGAECTSCLMPMPWLTLPLPPYGRPDSSMSLIAMQESENASNLSCPVYGGFSLRPFQNGVRFTYPPFGSDPDPVPTTARTSRGRRIGALAPHSAPSTSHLAWRTELFCRPAELFARPPELFSPPAELFARAAELFSRRAEHPNPARRAICSTRRAFFPDRRAFSPADRAFFLARRAPEPDAPGYFPGPPRNDLDRCSWFRRQPSASVSAFGKFTAPRFAHRVQVWQACCLLSQVELPQVAPCLGLCR